MESPANHVRLIACVAIAFLVGAASLPSALAEPGLWSVSKSASGSPSETVCVTEPSMLIQWEHRGKQCSSTILSSAADRAEVYYTCAGGGFGSSKVEVLTPRSVKIDTQGISEGYPFALTLHARRMGPCASR